MNEFISQISQQGITYAFVQAYELKLFSIIPLKNYSRTLFDRNWNY